MFFELVVKGRGREGEGGREGTREVGRVGGGREREAMREVGRVGGGREREAMWEGGR